MNNRTVDKIRPCRTLEDPSSLEAVPPTLERVHFVSSFSLSTYLWRTDFHYQIFLTIVAATVPLLLLSPSLVLMLFHLRSYPYCCRRHLKLLAPQKCKMLFCPSIATTNDVESNALTFKKGGAM